MAAIGVPSNTIRFCTSSCATIRRSTMRSPTSSRASRPAPRANTSWRAATCRRPPTRRISSPIRRCGGRWPSIWRASAPTCGRPAKSLRRWRRSARIWWNWTRVATDRELTMPSYDPNNIFAKILRGELPCYKVYEDEHALAFLDIMPRTPGHTLVLPKAPVRNMLDAKPDDLAHVMQAAQKVAKAAMTALAADGVTTQPFNEGAGG